VKIQKGAKFPKAEYFRTTDSEFRLQICTRKFGICAKSVNAVRYDPSAALTIVPVVPWEGTPQPGGWGGPINCQIFTTLL